MITFLHTLAILTVIALVLKLVGIISISWLWFTIPVGVLVFVYGSVFYALRMWGGNK
jgi:hypothetical protein